MTLPLNHANEYRALIAAQLREQAMTTIDDLWNRAVELMDRVDDAMLAGNETLALKLGAERDSLIAWAEDLERNRTPKTTEH